MAAHKKDYESVLATLVDHAPMGSTINKLNKVHIGTEDHDLKKLVAAVVSDVEQVLRDTSNERKSTKASFRPSLHKEPYKAAVDYCQRCIASVKPQWQILAERHGWGPKTKT